MSYLSRFLVMTLAALAISFPLLAQGGGRGPGGSMPPAGEAKGPGGPGGRLIVAADGTSLIVKMAPGAASTDAPVFQLVAVNSAGVAAWTWTAPAGIRDIKLASGLVIVSVGGGPGPASSGSSSAVSSQLVALNLTNGAQAWTATADGTFGEVEVASNGVRVIITKCVAATDATAQATCTRALQSLDFAGHILWSFALD